MVNWRKPIIFAALHMSGSKIPRYLREIEKISRMPQDEMKKYQEKQLTYLLFHAYKNVPYYNRILPESGVISDNTVDLAHFGDIPFLTKDIIRREGKNLYSVDYQNRKPYENFSGGSTGEPVRIIQDNEYYEWNIATILYFNQILGKQVGDKEIKFWGSDSDTIEGTIGIRNKMYNYLYNRHFINSHWLTPENLDAILNEYEKTRPDFIWSYLSSTFELARHMEKHNRTLSHPPKGIIVTAAVLSENVRNYLENILKTRIYNQYGSREVGAIACECIKQDGLHTFDFFQYSEVVDADISGNGEVVITNLRNFSMPLIRYRIGDTAKVKHSFCSCGRESHMLQAITGRTIDHFVLEDGTKIEGAYFVHLFLFKPWVKKFQIIQKDYSTIHCRIVINGEADTGEIRDIEKMIQFMMGDSCSVIFDFVDEIEPTKSGKYKYVICEVPY